MKILLIGNTLFLNGAEYVLASLARGLAKRGHEVDVALSKLQDEFQSAHPEWVAYSLPSSVNVIVGEYRRGRESVAALRRIMKKGRYDIVMCHASPYLFPLLLASTGLINRPKVIDVFHTSGGAGVDSEGNLINNRISFKQALLNFIYKRVDAVFTVSSGTADGVARVTGYPKNKMYVVYNPVLDEVFYEKIKKPPSHPWLKNPTVPVFVSAGVFLGHKNHILLIKSFAEVCKRYRARLVIFGEGPLRDEYLQLISKLGLSDLVSLPGFCNNILAEFKNAACCVVPSKMESFSVVCVEALASGIPVVATNCPYGPTEILKNGEYGILVENRNQSELAKAMELVLLGKGIKPTPEMVLAYTTEAILDRYENAMKSVLGQ